MFEQIHFDHTKDIINLATQTFTNLLNEISLRSLKLNHPKKAHKNNTQRNGLNKNVSNSGKL